MAGSITIKGLEVLTKKITDYSSGIQSEIDAELTSSAVIIRNEAKRINASTAFDEGRLNGSIVADTSTKYIKKVSVNIFYAPYIEFGTKKYVKVPTGLESYAASFKGKANRGSFEQFVDAIENWMKRKGIKAATEIEFVGKKVKKAKKRSTLSQAIAQRQLARHIAKRIMQNGIRPRPFLFPAMEAQKPILINNIKKIIAFE